VVVVARLVDARVAVGRVAKTDGKLTQKTLFTVKMSYEIAVFEYSDLYNGDQDVSPDKVICEFIEYYTRYFNPEFVEEGDVRLQRGRMWLSYTDNSGGDKPRTIMLMGSITDELVVNLKEAVAKVYVKTCWECEKEIKSKHRALCEECRDKE
jgi:hypothetical protein